MHRHQALLAAIAFVAGGTAQAASEVEPDAQLQRALKDRIAGDPVKCISLREVQSSRIINQTAILYEAGDTVYVNRPRSGAEGLNDWTVLVTKPQFSRLCSIDTITLFDPTIGRQRGSVILGEFVPYKRVSRSHTR